MPKNKHQKAKPAPSSTSKPLSIAPDPKLLEKLDTLDELVPTLEGAEPRSVSAPELLNEQLLRVAYNRAEQIYYRCEAIEARLDKDRKELEAKQEESTSRSRRADDELAKRENEAKKRDAELDKRASDLDAVQAANERARGELEAERKGLEAREKILVLREIDAKEGFNRLELEARQRWEKDWAALKAERLAEHDASIATMTRQHDAWIQARTDELNAKAAELTAREGQLVAQEAALSKSQRRLALDRATVDGGSEHLQKEVSAAAERGRAESRSMIDGLRRAIADKDAYIRHQSEIIRGFGDLDAAQLVRRNEELQKERDQLKLDLANRPDAVEAATLRAFEPLAKEHEANLAAERIRNGDLTQRLARHHQVVGELETQRDAIKSLEAQREILRRSRDELEKTYLDTVDKVQGQGAFTSLMRLDADHSTAGAVGKPPASLAELCEDARMVMADQVRYGADGARYYAAETIRTFIAGLAASRLHILQGLSGTGKTSLPLWFADAMLGQLGQGNDRRADCVATVSVQSGWRDRSDLLGHYNAFEKRFHESEFLQALYRAQTPAYANRPFFIVLDEMNLSHPEQYFADFLSALERPENDRFITLVDGEVGGGAPKLLREGRRIALPPNVWIIGTANQDETTKGVAPKTRDRAHIIDLSQQHSTFRVEARPSRRMAFGDLKDLFKQAEVSHASQLALALKRLEEVRTPLLKARIGMSNRLSRYLRSYVPVYVACGGTWTQALDHAVATKLVYGLQDRYEVTVAARKELLDAFGDGDWKATREQLQSVT